MSPIYPMRCECGHEQDVYARSMLAGKALADHGCACPKCGKKMRRVPAIVSIQFRGDGWTRKEERHE